MQVTINKEHICYLENAVKKETETRYHVISFCSAQYAFNIKSKICHSFVTQLFDLHVSHKEWDYFPCPQRLIY